VPLRLKEKKKSFFTKEGFLGELKKKMLEKWKINFPRSGRSLELLSEKVDDFDTI